MTDEFIRARLGYLEQALAGMVETPGKKTAKILAEQYVAFYGYDFNPISELTFSKILEEK